MADWYISSTAYAAIATFVPSVAYSVGQIVKPTAPVSQQRYAFRCTVAGTASTEPGWGAAWNNNQTVTTGGVTFMNVSGQSTYFWAAAAGDHQSMNGATGANRLPPAIASLSPATMLGPRRAASSVPAAQLRKATACCSS
jgi:hypothetical protein